MHAPPLPPRPAGLSQTRFHPAYLPLPDARSHIRLLVLEPAPTFESPLVGALVHVPLAQQSYFDALSYAWGSLGKTGAISLSGYAYALYESADAALRRLRRASETRAIWIDAMCINQEDSVEKSFQVPLMRQIYQQASQVYVYLGETKDADVRELLCRPWWTRTWVLQEAIVAKDVQFMYGPETFGWDLVGSMVSAQSYDMGLGDTYHSTHAPEEAALLGRYEALDELRRAWRGVGDKRIRMLEILYNFRGQGCTDPRDRIYSFLGLAHMTGVFGIETDYQLPTAQVYLRFARHDPSPIPYVSTATGQDLLYRASGDLIAQLSPSPPHILSLSGLHFDTISSISLPFHPPSSTPYFFRRPSDPRAQWESLALSPAVPKDGSLSPSPYSEPRLAFLRLHVGDFIPGEPVPPTDLSDVELWLNPSKFYGGPTIEDLANMSITDMFKTSFNVTAKSSAALHGQYSECAGRIHKFTAHRRLFVTRGGWMGLGSWDVREGDEVVVLRGGKTPFVIRRRYDVEEEKAERYEMIGEAYVQGIMMGEALEMGRGMRVWDIV
ncbi:heterokaryon incompatibility protein-domain-containing protein [Cercophora newfieldiana]|uniref:Heterokaryon incompatibility protein-domain-containing protein n=1 Tax=Cercophora newfieldiana TaxID=92897 RepID=A0AA40CQQ5_9PEZI|nr:heterokaryon incompatibility protein-domain-containing protein [Cercophora newfieldiana]